MARTTKAQAKFIDPDGEEWDATSVPKVVQDALDDYEKTRRAAGRAAAKKKAARENAIALMDKHGVEKARVRDENDRWVWIYRTDKPELKSKKVVEPKHEENGKE